MFFVHIFRQRYLYKYFAEAILYGILYKYFCRHIYFGSSVQTCVHFLLKYLYICRGCPPAIYSLWALHVYIGDALGPAEQTNKSQENSSKITPKEYPSKIPNKLYKFTRNSPINPNKIPIYSQENPSKIQNKIPAKSQTNSIKSKEITQQFQITSQGNPSKIQNS